VCVVHVTMQRDLVVRVVLYSYVYKIFVLLVVVIVVVMNDVCDYFFFVQKKKKNPDTR